jgi:cytochrome c553
MAPATVPSPFFAEMDVSLMNFSKPILSVVLISSGFAFAQAASNAATSSPLYKVVDGTKVDSETMKGFRTWRAAACDRCHGPNQEGLVGPSLINSLKTLSKDDFVKTVTNGRLEKDTDGLGAVGGYRELNQYTELGGSLTVFALPGQ